MDFRLVFCTVSTVEHMETVSKWNIDEQPQQRFVTPLRLKYS